MPVPVPGQLSATSYNFYAVSIGADSLQGFQELGEDVVRRPTVNAFGCNAGLHVLDALSSDDPTISVEETTDALLSWFKLTCHQVSRLEVKRRQVFASSISDALSQAFDDKPPQEHILSQEDENKIKSLAKQQKHWDLLRKQFKPSGSTGASTSVPPSNYTSQPKSGRRQFRAGNNRNKSFTNTRRSPSPSSAPSGRNSPRVAARPAGGAPP